jgi:hypothetical protein
MANEILKIDENGHAVMGALTNNAAAEIRNLKVDPTTGRLLVDVGTISVAADGAIVDGASSAIKATVKSYTNANPLTVRLTDTNGDYVSAGGGTQYTEDAAAAADPVGNMTIVRRRDTLTVSEVSADGDNIALNATSKGEIYVKQTDVVPINDNSGSLTVDAPVGTPAFVRLSDGSAAITTLPVSLATVPSHAVTNAGTFAVQADTELPAAAALADDTANPTVPGVGAYQMIWDPGDANWDRLRAITATLNAAAPDSGIMAAGLTAQFDDTAPTTVTENQWGNLRISTNRNLYNTIRDAAGNERGANVNASSELVIGGGCCFRRC